MKTVIVRPERCVGCLQCRLACAVEHSASKNLYAAISEPTRPQARLRIYPGGRHLAFPNKCRHCDPAPCQEVCIAGAIRRDASRGTVDIDPQRCISCAMCAMACPFGVLTYAPLAAAPDQAGGGPEVRPVPGPGESRQSPGLCYGLQGRGPDLRRLAHGPGRPRPGHCPGLLRDAPGGGIRSPVHPAPDPPLAPVGINFAGRAGDFLYLLRKVQDYR